MVFPVWFDTHLHLDPEDEPRDLFARARLAGVGHFLIAGTDEQDSRRGLAVAASESGVVAAVGLHPHEARRFADLGPFRELLGSDRAVAVGEIGLDYYYDHSPRSEQRRVFAAFLALAADLRRPAIVHCRDAFADCLPMLREASAAGVKLLLHSFTGTPAQAEEVLGLGAMLSFSGMVTFPKGDNIRETLSVVPLERLLVETDSPYLAPVPHRGQRNQPAFVVAVGRRIAEEKRVRWEDVAAATTRNALQVFGMQA